MSLGGCLNVGKKVKAKKTKKTTKAMATDVVGGRTPLGQKRKSLYPISYRLCDWVHSLYYAL